MKQAIMISPGKIEYNDIQAPEKLEPNEVFLKIQRIGICGSDIHVSHGEHPATPYPIVQGREYSATVEAVGEKVSKAKHGDEILQLAAQCMVLPDYKGNPGVADESEMVELVRGCF